MPRLLRSIPGLARTGFAHLKSVHGLSDLSIVLGALALPVLLGAIIICVVDAMYMRRARSSGAGDGFYSHEHQE